MLECAEGLTTAVVVLLVDCQRDRAHLISCSATCFDIEVGFGVVRAPVFSSSTARVCLSLFSGARGVGRALPPQWWFCSLTASAIAPI